MAVLSAPSFENLLDFNDLVFSSYEYKTFAEEVKDIRKILRVFTTFIMKEYNVPEGMGLVMK